MRQVLASDKRKFYICYPEQGNKSIFYPSFTVILLIEPERYFMADKRTAVIIGAGIGGITTAVYLAKNGYSVSVYEKNSSPGGRCGQLVRDGHRFDLGATMLMMPGIYHEVFDSLGVKLEEGKDIVPMRDLYTIFFDDCSQLVFTSDRERMKLPAGEDRTRQL